MMAKASIGGMSPAMSFSTMASAPIFSSSTPISMNLATVCTGLLV